MMGIYKITNLINNKVYIGQSVDIKIRWSAHKYNNSKDSVIHRAIKKYGLENFEFSIIEECSQEQLNEREQYWIKYYDSYYNGYNCTLGGDGAIKIDYNQIYDLWLKGYSCKEIIEELNYDDGTITKALRAYNVSEEETRSRAQTNIIQIVAIDIISNTPLKIFNGCKATCKYFNENFSNASSLYQRLDKKQRMFGYYWERLTNLNKPDKELTNEEFLSYQQKKLFTLTEEQKDKISRTQRTVERPNREELKKLIRTMPFLTIGKKYGVSDNAIKKWCQREKLPYRKKDIIQYTDEEWEEV